MVSRNFGIKVSQRGYDVRTTGDSNLLFSSSWPLLKIHKEGVFDTTTGAAGTSAIITEHSLDYYPAFLIFVDDNVEGGSSIHTTDRFTAGAAVDEKYLKVIDPLNLGAQNLKGYYYIFQVDLEEKFEAPTIRTGGVAGGASDNYGFKATKGDIESGQLKDHVLDSSTRSPMVHQVTPGVTDNESGGIYTNTVFHTLPYQPMYMAYVKGDLGYEMNAGSDALGFTLTIGQQSIVVSSFLDKTEFSLLLFKDPLEVGDPQETITS